MLNGGHFELYESHKKPVLVHFWASWCPVCKLEQSGISAIAKDYPVITIAMQSGDDAEIKQYMKNEKLFFPVINDMNGSLSHRYGIKGVPVSLVINKKNNIEFTEMGYTSEIGLRLRLWWAGL